MFKDDLLPTLIMRKGESNFNCNYSQGGGNKGKKKNTPWRHSIQEAVQQSWHAASSPSIWGKTNTLANLWGCVKVIIFLKISQVERPTWHILLVMKHAPSTDCSLWLSICLNTLNTKTFFFFFFPQAEIARQQQSADSGARDEDMLTTSKGIQKMPHHKGRRAEDSPRGW